MISSAILFLCLLQISAQESRRKKKEFVDTLERQVELASHELGECKRRCQALEKENANLVAQLERLRDAVANGGDSLIKADAIIKREIKVKMEEEDEEGRKSSSQGVSENQNTFFVVLPGLLLK